MVEGTAMSKLKDICTYHNDDGTSGYLLSEEQFEQIKDLMLELWFKANHDPIKFKQLVDEL